MLLSHKMRLPDDTSGALVSMPSEIWQYVHIYHNMLDPKTVRAIVRRTKKVKWSSHTYTHNGQISSAAKNSSTKNELLVAYTGDDFPELAEAVKRSLAKYVEVVNLPWLGPLAGFSSVRLNKYPKRSTMKTHCDFIHTAFDGTKRGIPTLSVVGALNDNYEGGKLVMFEESSISLPPGAILVFPSTFMYPHRVDPVTKGERLTFVSWGY